MGLKILGVGLGRTGTTSLAAALTILGYKTLHWCPERLRDIMDGSNTRPRWRRYDDVDAVVDVPAALFYRELIDAYPDIRCILTIRDAASWFPSIQHLTETDTTRGAGMPQWVADEARACHIFAYGSYPLKEVLAKKRFAEHNRMVQLSIPAERLLVMDIHRGWNPLCAFLGKPIPDEPFPHDNARIQYESESKVPH